MQNRCPHERHPLSAGVSGHSQQLGQDGAWGNGIAVKRLQFRNMPAIDTQVFNRVCLAWKQRHPNTVKQTG